MKKLAIEGDKNNDVITLLVMLGGENKNLLMGNNPNCVYFIHHGLIDCIEKQNLSNDYIVYTFEEFNKKHIFKINDMVNIPEYESEVRINAMKWSVYTKTVLYMVHRVDKEEWYTTEELLGYNDIEDYKNIESKNIKSNKKETITIDGFKANTKEWLIDKLESMSKDNALQAICDIYDEPHKPKYPKTYEECCMILQNSCMTHRGGYKGDLMQTFQKLLICRDTYWKIAGKEMGLDKPWEPDWSSCEDKFCITILKNKQTFDDSQYISRILAFPTEEIRDTFYENFKDLIERCKELI